MKLLAFSSHFIDVVGYRAARFTHALVVEHDHRLSASWFTTAGSQESIVPEKC